MASTWQEMYALLGLEDLDTFAARQAAGQDPRQVLRGIGSSTWMAAHAALALLNNLRDVAIVADNVHMARLETDIVLKFVNAANPGLSNLVSSSLQNVRIGGNTLRWSARPWRLEGVIQPLEFDSRPWVGRLTRRVRGPFDMIREICIEGDRYFGYAEDGELVLEFALDGVKPFLDTHPDIIAPIGLFLDSMPRSAYVGVAPPLMTEVELGSSWHNKEFAMPTLRGSFGMDVKPTKSMQLPNVKARQESAWKKR